MMHSRSILHLCGVHTALFRLVASSVACHLSLLTSHFAPLRNDVQTEGTCMGTNNMKDEKFRVSGTRDFRCITDAVLELLEFSLILVSAYVIDGSEPGLRVMDRTCNKSNPSNLNLLKSASRRG
ncbi:hypothetical protein QBC45DRAFT_399773 [Copromyces sp. CBS 386.78]|nr:hypothetical protein QBC45DRAFT_399773 [Copromyces sp. CBS 386.78]